MAAPDVLAALDALSDAGVPTWVGGGWAVDALIGEQTRVHRDLDVAIPTERDADSITALAGLGYRLEEDQRPVRFMLAADGGRRIDFHPVRFEEGGAGVQQGFDGNVFVYPPEDMRSEGLIGGRRVRCISPRLQVVFHAGYDPTDRDLADMTALRERLTASPDRP